MFVYVSHSMNNCSSNHDMIDILLEKLCINSSLLFDEKLLHII